MVWHQAALQIPPRLPRTAAGTNRLASAVPPKNVIATVEVEAMRCKLRGEAKSYSLFTLCD
eukprot:6899530-Pyramimonas_sp.AAC.1